MVRGTLTPISVHFAIPDRPIMSFTPGRLGHPGGTAVGPVTAGSEQRILPGVGERSGNYSFAIEPPSFLPPARIVTNMNIFDEHTLTLAPAALELAPGTSARVVVTIGPVRRGYTTRWADWTIAAVESAADVDGNSSFVVYGLTPGQTEIVVKLPASVGGATARLPVVVKEPEKPGRRRAAAIDEGWGLVVAIDPRHPLTDSAKHLIGDRVELRRDLFGRDLVVSLPAEKHDFIPDSSVVDVRTSIVTRSIETRPTTGHAFSADEHLAPVRQSATVAVGVAHRQRGDARGARRVERGAVADGVAGWQLFQRAMAVRQRRTGSRRGEWASSGAAPYNAIPTRA